MIGGHSAAPTPAGNAGRTRHEAVAARARLVKALLDGVAGQLHGAMWDDDACTDLLRQATIQLLAIARDDR